MTRGSFGLVLPLAAVAFLVAGCAAAPLPSMRSLAHQSAKDLAWDSRTCAWAAEDGSGYWADLSTGESAIVDLFTHGPVRTSSEEWPRAVTTPEAVAPAAPSPAHLGRGGRRAFEDVYEQCMIARGYERSSRAVEERPR